MLMFVSVTTMTVDTCGLIRVTDGVHLLCSILDEEGREERRTVRLAREDVQLVAETAARCVRVV